VHLASALAVKNAGLELTFLASDERLLQAARAEGLAAENPAAV
jgi:hypothetical protein